MFLPVFIEEIDDLISEAIDLDEVKGDVESLDEGDNDNDDKKIVFIKVNIHMSLKIKIVLHLTKLKYINQWVSDMSYLFLRTGNIKFYHSLIFTTNNNTVCYIFLI